MRSAPKEREELRARAEITSHFAAGPQAHWQGASDELYPGRYVRSEQRSQRDCGPQPEGARRRGAVCVVGAPRRCAAASPASRRLASGPSALAPKCEFISARALRLAWWIQSSRVKILIVARASRPWEGRINPGH